MAMQCKKKFQRTVWEPDKVAGMGAGIIEAQSVGSSEQNCVYSPFVSFVRCLLLPSSQPRSLDLILCLAPCRPSEPDFCTLATLLRFSGARVIGTCKLGKVR
jgi:hypothetical protein